VPQLLHRNTLAIILPGLLVVLGLMVANKFIDLPTVLKNSRSVLPYLFILPTLVLSLAFRLSREFNLLLILLLVFWCDQNLIWQNTPKLSYNKSLLINSLAVLLPLNILIHNILLERGNFSLHGLKRIGITLLQILLVIAVLWMNMRSINTVYSFNPVDFIWSGNKTVPGLAHSLFVITAIYLIYRIARNPSLLNIAQPTFLIACYFALYYTRQPELASTFITIAAAIMLISVILNSYSLAYIDELTGLPSRRALKQELMAVGQRYCLAMLDIDHFKKLNDTYGHDVGDQVLRMVASRIRRTTGCSRAFRYGGEEFTLVFAGKNLDEARVFANMVCERIAAAPFLLRGKRRPRKKPQLIGKAPRPKKVDVTISIGIAEYKKRHESPQDVLKDADKALYKAKEKGRNRVCS